MKKEERDRLRFAEAVCFALKVAARDKVITLTCPICGAQAVAVHLAEGDRRGACRCGARFFERIEIT